MGVTLDTTALQRELKCQVRQWAQAAGSVGKEFASRDGGEHTVVLLHRLQ